MNSDHTQYGTRIRANYQLLPFASIEGEVSYDTQRKFIGFAGIKLNYPLLKKSKNTLITKMTSLPVRDIDIVISNITKENVPNDYSVEKKGLAYMIDPEHANDPYKERSYKDIKKLIQASSEFLDDIAVMDQNVLLFISDFGQRVATPGTEFYAMLVDFWEDIRRDKYTIGGPAPIIINRNSTLAKIISQGFWTSYGERAENRSDVALLRKNDVANKIVTMQCLDERMLKGTPRGAVTKALKWKFRDNNAVFVADFAGTTDSYTFAENHLHFASAVAPAKSNAHPSRYIVMNLHMINHATPLVIDKHNHHIMFMDPNGIPMTHNQRRLMRTQFPTYRIEDYNPVIQNEDWSCSIHTYQNIVDYVAGKYDSRPTTRQYRNLRDISELVNLALYQ